MIDATERLDADELRLLARMGGLPPRRRRFIDRVVNLFLRNPEHARRRMEQLHRAMGARQARARLATRR